MRKDKYPQLAPIYDGLVKERDTILATVAPLRALEEPLQKQLDELAGKLTAVRQKIADAEGQRLRDVCNQIAALERAAGAKTVVSEKGHIVVTP